MEKIHILLGELILYFQSELIFLVLTEKAAKQISMSGAKQDFCECEGCYFLHWRIAGLLNYAIIV